MIFPNSKKALNAKAIGRMANPNKRGFLKVEEWPLKRGRTELCCKAQDLCSLSLNNADSSVHKQLTQTKPLNLSILIYKYVSYCVIL